MTRLSFSNVITIRVGFIKNIIFLFLIFIIFSGFGYLGGGYHGTTHEPVYMSWEELRSAVKLEDPRQPNRRGKIYLYKDWILLNEPNKGIHIIDNAVKTNPENIHFINIPGNVDIAVRNDRLFVDSFTDLVVIDISDPQKIREVSRRKDVFDYNPYQVTDNDRSFRPEEVYQENGVVIDWIRVEQ